MTITGEFSVPIYDCEVKIIVTSDILRSIHRYYRKHKETDRLKVPPRAFFYHPGGEETIHYLFFKTDCLTANEINHEKSHLVEQILDDRGIKPVDEVRSYLDGFVSNKIDLFFKRHKNRIKFTSTKKAKKAH